MKPWWNNKTFNYSKKCLIPPFKEPPDKINSGSWFTMTQKDFETVDYFEIEKKKTNSYEKQPIIGRKRKKIGESSRKRLKKNPLMRNLKVRIYPNKNQKKILKRWIGTGRFMYNQTINEINEDYKNKKNSKKFETVNKLMGKNCDLVKEKPWLLETPSHVKSNSIIEAFKARKTCFSLKKRGKIKKFKLKLRCKKRGGVITIPKTSFSKRKKEIGLIYRNRKEKIGKLKIRSKKAKILIEKGLEYDSKIMFDRNRKYWLIIPYVSKIENQNFRREFVALDPGVRTFQTYYSPNGNCGEIGKNDLGRIHRLSKHLDNLHSRMTKVKSKKRYRMKKALFRLINRIKNLVNEVHKKTSKFLTSRYKNILLPIFESSKMVLKSNRNIRSKTAKAMLTWSHYRFKERLSFVCKRTKTKLFEVTEEYTSKTCGRCGKINNSLGGNKTFNCPNCKLQIDRDINGARNIFLKFLTSDIRSVVIDHHTFKSMHWSYGYP